MYQVNQESLTYFSYLIGEIDIIDVIMYSNFILVRDWLKRNG